MTPIWVALGLNPFTDTLYFIGIAKTKKKADRSFKRVDDDVAYRKTFLATAPDFGQSLYEWFRHCRIPESEATKLFEMFRNKWVEFIDRVREDKP